MDQDPINTIGLVSALVTTYEIGLNNYLEYSHQICRSQTYGGRRSRFPAEEGDDDDAAHADASDSGRLGRAERGREDSATEISAPTPGMAPGMSALQASLKTSPRRIRDVYDRAFILIGPEFSRGDAQCRETLTTSLTLLRAAIATPLTETMIALSKPQRPHPRPSPPNRVLDLHSMVFASSKVLNSTIWALAMQYERLAGGRSLPQTLPGVKVPPKPRGSVSQRGTGGLGRIDEDHEQYEEGSQRRVSTGGEDDRDARDERDGGRDGDDEREYSTPGSPRDLSRMSRPPVEMGDVEGGRMGWRDWRDEDTDGGRRRSLTNRYSGSSSGSGSVYSAQSAPPLQSPPAGTIRDQRGEDLTVIETEPHHNTTNQGNEYRLHKENPPDPDHKSQPVPTPLSKRSMTTTSWTTSPPSPPPTPPNTAFTISNPPSEKNSAPSSSGSGKTSIRSSLRPSATLPTTTAPPPTAAKTEAPSRSLHVTTTTLSTTTPFPLCPISPTTRLPSLSYPTPPRRAQTFDTPTHNGAIFCTEALALQSDPTLPLPTGRCGVCGFMYPATIANTSPSGPTSPPASRSQSASESSASGREAPKSPPVAPRASMASTKVSKILLGSSAWTGLFNTPERRRSSISGGGGGTSTREMEGKGEGIRLTARFVAKSHCPVIGDGLERGAGGGYGCVLCTDSGAGGWEERYEGMGELRRHLEGRHDGWGLREGDMGL